MLHQFMMSCLTYPSGHPTVEKRMSRPFMVKKKSMTLALKVENMT